MSDIEQRLREENCELREHLQVALGHLTTEWQGDDPQSDRRLWLAEVYRRALELAYGRLGPKREPA